jgi:hypothetical protein
VNGLLRRHTHGMRRFMQSVQAARTALLCTAGLGLLTAAAWVAWGVAPGLAAGGVGALLLEYLSGDDKGRKR